MSDYVREEDLRLTHELIGFTLGVRRASVSVACGVLKDAGAITNHRASIPVRDRRRLEEKACECYRVIKDEFDRIYADLATS